MRGIAVPAATNAALRLRSRPSRNRGIGDLKCDKQIGRHGRELAVLRAAVAVL